MKQIEKLKVCIDIPNESNHHLHGLFNAFVEREENIVNEHYKRIMDSDTITEQTLIDSGKEKSFDKLLYAKKESRDKLSELALYRNKIWQMEKH